MPTKLAKLRSIASMAELLFAAVESVCFSALIYVVLSANLVPDGWGSTATGITTTAVVFAVIGLWAMFHVYVKTSARVPIRKSWRGARATDWFFTLLPLATIFGVEMYMAPFVAKVAWWPEVSSWAFWIFLGAVIIDVFDGARKWIF